MSRFSWLLLPLLVCLLLLNPVDALALRVCDRETVDALYRSLMDILPAEDRPYLEKSQELWEKFAVFDGARAEDNSWGGTAAVTAADKKYRELCQPRCDFLEGLITKYRSNVPAFRRENRIVCNYGDEISYEFSSFAYDKFADHSNDDILKAVKKEIEIQIRKVNKKYNERYAEIKEDCHDYDTGKMNREKYDTMTGNLEASQGTWVSSVKADIQLEKRKSRGIWGQVDVQLQLLNLLIERLRTF